MAEHFHCLPEVVGQHSVGWVLTTYRRVLKARWDLLTAQVQAIELGTGRAIAQSLGGKKVRLPELPTFEEVLRQKAPVRLPEWMQKFEAANQPQDDGA